MPSTSEDRRLFVRQLVNEWRTTQGVEIERAWGSLVGFAAETDARMMAEAFASDPHLHERRLRLDDTQVELVVRRVASSIRNSIFGAHPLRDPDDVRWRRQMDAIEHSFKTGAPLPSSEKTTPQPKKPAASEPEADRKTASGD